MPDQVSGLLSPLLRSWRIAAVRPYLKEGEILDYGCGVGRLAELVSPERYLGVDIDPETLAKARQANPSHVFLSAGQLASEMPDRRFDTIVAMALIEHLREPAAWVAEISKLLKPGGRIILTTPNPSLQRIYEWGSEIGLFSRDAAHEHFQYFDCPTLEKVLLSTRSRIVRYHRFLFGCNQLFELKCDS